MLLKIGKVMSFKKLSAVNLLLHLNQVREKRRKKSFTSICTLGDWIGNFINTRALLWGYLESVKNLLQIVRNYFKQYVRKSF